MVEVASVIIIFCGLFAALIIWATRGRAETHSNTHTVFPSDNTRLHIDETRRPGEVFPTKH